MLIIYLKHMLDDSIWGTKQVHTRDASHLCLHCAGRQVLLSEAWNDVHHVQGGAAGRVRVTQRPVTIQRRRHTYIGQTLSNLFNSEVLLAERADETQAELLNYWTNTLGRDTTQHLFSHSAPVLLNWWTLRKHILLFPYDNVMSNTQSTALELIPQKCQLFNHVLEELNWK